MLSVHNKIGGTLNTAVQMYILNYFAPLMTRVCKKNRNYDNDNDKLKCLQKRLISQKYKKCSPGKYAMLLYVAVSIRWISMRFDFAFIYS